MTCDERRDLLLLYAADALDASEAQELRAHLASGCPQCAGALAEAQATVAHVPLALDPVAAPKSAREKLMQRITDASPQLKLTSAPPMRRGPTVFKLFTTGAIAAALAALLTAATIFYVTRDTPRFNDPSLQVVSLNRQDTQPKAHGRIAWNRKTDEWDIYVFEMKPPPAGREYELWFMPAGKAPVRGPTFTVDASGHAKVRATVPQNVGTLIAAAITDEPIGGVDSPTGKAQLYGEIK